MQTNTMDFSLSFNCRDDQTSEQLVNVSINWEVKDPLDNERTRLNLNKFLSSINSNLVVVYKNTNIVINAENTKSKSKKS